MKFYEILEAEIKKQKKVQMLMDAKKQKKAELEEIDRLLRKLIQK